MSIKSNILRYMSPALAVAGAGLAYFLVPDLPDEQSAGKLADILVTYITVASILAGFSSGISNQFVAASNEKMIKLIREKKLYRKFVRRFRRSTILNILGMLVGFIQIIAMKLTNIPQLSRWGTIAVITISGGGIGAFITSSFVSSKLAELTEEYYDEL